ncbi:ABC transporter ATP-binding protein [Bacillus massiliigorillae]|uniref:ABC transporter ATP-binding protein n=1 Tax=Bacillus massiliigorillae TaxID=1243664 RepID=UPI00039F3923|nr:oligopeptide/dipeptide ABC transporter ATP-binding protein [Bacillus massiliigorillae]
MGLTTNQILQNQSSTKDTPLLQVKDLRKYFSVGKQQLKAVDGLNFDIYKGETVGLVGESGCGKSTAGRTIIRLYEPTEGEVLFEGKNIYKHTPREMSELRKNIQLIFQDPYASLNPRMTIEEVVSEPLVIHGVVKGVAKRKRVEELVELVGLSTDHLNRFPHEFSGGQRQRVGIARALALNPKFIVCDEPISALDVSIQAQVVNLLKSLQKEMGLTYLFVAHDLSMVKYISNRILVMYLGKMMELADSETLCNQPLHPYTQALLSAVPIPDPTLKRERIILKGDVPSPINPPSGCVFRTRCPKAMDICASVVPEWVEQKSGHFVACHLY